MTTLFVPHYETSSISNYGIEAINASSFWKDGYEGQGTVVAVIDSGCDTNHPELKDNIIGQYNFTSDDQSEETNVTDYSGHGTHVSGIIAASNKEKKIGIAPKASLLILKIIDSTGNGDFINLINAINYAVNWEGPNHEKVNIINLSLGGKYEFPSLREVIQQAISNNIFIVVAAGNYGDGNEITDEILYPGFYEEVIQVAAVDVFDKPLHFSNTNTTIDFLAPGKDIYSTFPEDKYKTMSGTSMAAPHASGSIALLLNAYKSRNMKTNFHHIYQYLVSNTLCLEGYSKHTQGNGVLKL